MADQKQEKFDVGVVGVGVGANYGSVLTYYSLYKTIESFGKKVLMVSKIGAKASDPEIQNTHAIRFAREHYNLSKLYSQKTVKELNKIADTFVIGSDQVWNYGISQHFAKAFYLDFAGDDKRKLSYAASFGHAKDLAPAEEVPKISALMKRFNAISVREDVGVDIARDTYGVPAKQVAEPIFLTGTEKYRELAARSTLDVSEPYLLAYILDPTPEKKAAIEHVAKKLGLKIRIILDAWPHLFEENKKKMDIAGAVEEGIETYDFLKLYANCSYVVTDSFHGTAFALKFEKPFASIGNKRRGVVRFDSMFRLIGNRDRFTMKPEEIVKKDARFLAPMDYAKITSALDKHVKESKDWLKASLEKPVKDTIGASEPKTTVASKPKTVDTGGTVSVEFRGPANAVGKVVDFLKHQLSKQRFKLDRPTFTANNEVWRTEPLARATRIAVASADAAVRGNLVWTDLPVPLRANTAYELTIEWTLRTSSRSVNLHIRNPETGKFKVVGTIPVGPEVDVRRTDTVSFMVPGDGFTQIMFGAVHFSGVNAGADIATITVQSIRPDAVVPNAPAIPAGKAGRDPALVARELSQADNDRFIGAYAQHRVSRNIANARSLMMYYSHGFEKGLSRTTNFRPGFGEATMSQLAPEMNKWVAAGHSTQDSFFQIAASVMHSYFERHKEAGVDVSHFMKLFSPAVQAEINKADKTLGGAVAAHADREPVLDSIQNRNFLELAFGRRSVREFTSEPVKNEDIRRAVEIAMQAPSVCNRQPARVHQFDDVDTMRAVLDLQGGFRGYKMPPKLLLVTSDLSAFVAAVERNQAFIDGGLFMMMLLLGIEQVGLGGCSLNTAMSKEREDAIRKILNLPESEILIAFIAVGHFDPEVMIPRSKRIGLDEVLVKHS
ncbi:polysaccharide pyruvyl transferase family protein [Pararhizobium arenae]|uniref:polysaccharide pyruvyl transferase family protein n=1 Tax=Pararhizobium arenae TaxID=1856850 RepID=UPI00094B613B|nr:polysaccharide pyruvyl transferase family protein [Pararhizobium arenae]